MTFPTNIGKVYVKAQAGGWGVAETSFADSDLISAGASLPKFMVEALESPQFRGGWHNFQIQPGSREGAEFPIDHICQGWSMATPAANPTESPDALMLRSVLGAGAAIGYTSGALEPSGQTTSLVKLVDTTLSPAWPGMALLLPLAGGGRELAWVKTIDSAATPDELVPWFTMAAAADGSGTPVTFGGYTCWDTIGTPADPFTLQVLLGANNTGWRGRDSVCTRALITLEAGKQPKVAYTTLSGYWSPDGTWTVAPYVLTRPELPGLMGANGSRARVPGVQTIFPKIEIEFTADYQPARGLGQTDAFGEFICVGRSQQVTVTEVLGSYASSLRFPGTETATGLQVDLCNIPGRAWSVFMPLPQVTVTDEDEDGNGFVVRKSVYKARHATVETAGTNASRSHTRVSLL
jgi:hypothetical protein